MDEIEKRRLIKDLNELNKNLLDYKKRQERHIGTKFTEGQMKKLDELRTRTRSKYRLLKILFLNMVEKLQLKLQV